METIYKTSIKSNFIATILLIFTLGGWLLLAGCQSNKPVANTKTEINSTTQSKVSEIKNNQWITASIFNSKGKGSIWLVDAENGKKESLVKDRQVMISGRINFDGSKLIYSDALGDGPWDAFLLDTKTQDVYQVTNDPIGQFNLCFGDKTGNLVYAMAGGASSPVPKIHKIDIDKKKSEILNIGDKDRAIQCFDIYNGNIIAITYSFSEDRSRHHEKNVKKLNKLPAMIYTIIQTDTQGGEIKEIAKVKAERLDSLCWVSSGNAVTLNGAGIEGNEDPGYYSLDIKKGKVSKLLTELDLKGTNKIMKLSTPYLSCLIVDEKKIYFSGVPSGCKEVSLSDLTFYPSYLYCYDLQSKELNEVLEEPDSAITNLSVTYH